MSARRTDQGLPWLVVTVAGEWFAGWTGEFETVLSGRVQSMMRSPAERRCPWWIGTIERDQMPIPVVAWSVVFNLEPPDLDWNAKLHAGQLLLARVGGMSVAFLVDACNGMVYDSQRLHLTRIQSYWLEDGGQFLLDAFEWNQRIVLVFCAEEWRTGPCRSELVDAMSHQDTSRMVDLRLKEVKLGQNPDLQGYLDLAKEYDKLGLSKDAQRCLQHAEACESEQASGNAASLSGVLRAGTVIEIIQICSQGGKTGQLVLEGPEATYRLTMQTGTVIAAECTDGSRGSAAFFNSVRVREGMFNFVEKSVSDIAPEIRESTSSLLLEAVRAMDEGHSS